MPLGVAMGLVGFAGLTLLFDFGMAITKVGLNAFNVTYSFIIAVIPMFVLMGELGLPRVNHRGLSRCV